jgi:hypothetical protein
MAAVKLAQSADQSVMELAEELGVRGAASVVGSTNMMDMEEVRFQDVGTHFLIIQMLASVVIK